MFQKYHREAKTIYKLPPLNLIKQGSSSKDRKNMEKNEKQDVANNQTNPEEVEEETDDISNNLTTTTPPTTTINPEIEVSTNSARRNYLAECVKNNLPPMSNLIIRKIKSKELNLANYGIGDDLGNALASGLMDMPNIETLDLSDNRLTGKSLSKTCCKNNNISRIKYWIE